MYCNCKTKKIRGSGGVAGSGAGERGRDGDGTRAECAGEGSTSYPSGGPGGRARGGALGRGCEGAAGSGAGECQCVHLTATRDLKGTGIERTRGRRALGGRRTCGGGRGLAGDRPGGRRARAGEGHSTWRFTLRSVGASGRRRGHGSVEGSTS